MNIHSTKFKNIKGVMVETEKFKAVFLPEHGGKLASLKDTKTGYELLAQDKNEIYLGQNENSNYVENEVSAVDDLFPTIDPCRTGFAEDALYPCHGEVLRYPHKYTFDKSRLEMEFISDRFGYKFKKRIKEDKNGALVVSYCIENTTKEDFPCIFGLHCMLAAAEGGYAITFEEKDDAVIMFDDLNEIGKRMDRVKVSKKMLTSSKYSTEANAYKFYLENKKKIGKCGYFNPEINKKIILSYDVEKLPYLGIWINNGMFKGMYNVALESCTMPYDAVDIANEYGFEFVIKKEDSFTFDITYDLGD